MSPVQTRIQTEVAEIIIDPDNIVHLVFNGKMVGVEQAKEVVRVSLEINPEQESRPVLIGGQTNALSNKEAWAVFGKTPHLHSMTKAMALVVDSWAARMVGKAFMAIHKPPYKAKIFGNSEEALKWLRKQA